MLPLLFGKDLFNNKHSHSQIKFHFHEFFYFSIMKIHLLFINYVREEINILVGNPFEKQTTTRWIRSPFNPTSPKVTKRCPSALWHEFHLEISKSIPGFLSLVCPRRKNEIFMRELEFPSCLRQYGGKNARKWLLEGLLIDKRVSLHEKIGSMEQMY